MTHVQDNLQRQLHKKKFEQVSNVIRNYCRLTIHAVSETVGIDKESVWRNLHASFNMKNKCSKMVPKILSPEQKAAQINFLKKLGADPMLLDRVIKCDESWFFTYDLETMRQSLDSVVCFSLLFIYLFSM